MLLFGGLFSEVNIGRGVAIMGPNFLSSTRGNRFADYRSLLFSNPRLTLSAMRRGVGAAQPLVLLLVSDGGCTGAGSVN